MTGWWEQDEERGRYNSASDYSGRFHDQFAPMTRIVAVTDSGTIDGAVRRKEDRFPSERHIVVSPTRICICVGVYRRIQVCVNR